MRTSLWFCPHSSRKYQVSSPKCVDIAELCRVVIPELGRVSPYGGVRPRSERGLGERRHRPRHRGLRGREHPPLVGDDGCAALSRRDPPAHHRRRRREQRLPAPPVEWELQKLADETGLEIAVCHLPPGTSKWNKIEHRLFSAITQNWRASRSSVTRSSSSSSPRRLRRPASFAPTRNPSARTWGRGSQRTRPFTRLGGVGESACRIRRVFMTGPHPRPSGRPEDRHVRASPTR